MYRYRYNGGTSRGVKMEFIHRLGEITQIVAKRFVSTRSWVAKGDDGKPVKHSYTTDHEVVMVYGKNGTARFNGCCWGYQGEGPRTTFKVLLECGIPKEYAEHYAFNVPRNTRPGVDWSITILPELAAIRKTDWTQS